MIADKLSTQAHNIARLDAQSLTDDQHSHDTFQQSDKPRDYTEQMKHLYFCDILHHITFLVQHILQQSVLPDKTSICITALQSPLIYPAHSENALDPAEIYTTHYKQQPSYHIAPVKYYLVRSFI